MTNVAAEAARLAGLGYRVFPCLQDKSPATPGGCTNARTDPPAGWFDGGRMLAVECGGLLVVDVDGDANPWLPTPQGREAFANAGACGRTPSGGLHLWYRLPDGAECRNTRSVLAEKIDTRTAGGYVVAPPSVGAGGRYLWEMRLDVPPSRLPMAPRWLLEATARPQPLPEPTPQAIPADDFVLTRAAAYLEAMPPSVSGAGGHAALMRAANALAVGFALSDLEATRLLEERFNPRCDPPWSARELAHKIAQARKRPPTMAAGSLRGAKFLEVDAEALIAAGRKPAAEAKADPEFRPAGWRPFPTHALPEPMRAFVRACAVSVGVDEGMVAPHCLPVAAAAIGNSRCAEVMPDWREPSILWTAVSADSGSKKSPPFSKARAPWAEIEDEADRAAQSAAHDAMAKWEAGGRQGPYRAPAMTQTIIEDITTEAVFAQLNLNRRGLLLASDELKGWFGSFGLYKSGASGVDAAAWIKCHGAERHTVNRKGSADGRPIIVARPAVSVCGCIQPETLRTAATSENKDSGLLARLLIAEPPTNPARIAGCKPMPIPVVAAWANVVKALHALPMRDDLTTGNPMPLALPLTAEAFRIYEPWHDAQADRAHVSERDVSAAVSKLRGAAVRIALVWQLCEEPASAEIESAAIRAGMEIAEWFGNEAERLYDRLAMDARERSTAELVRWVRRRGGAATCRQLMAAFRRYRASGAAKTALDGLVSAGLAEWEATGRGETCRMKGAEQ